jgi:hypothetical protein
MHEERAMDVDGDYLVIKIDLTKDFGESKSGKTDG